MELSALREYLNQEILRLEEYDTEMEHMFDKYNYHIREIDKKKQAVEENFDFAYEAFSPISKVEKMQEDIEKLEKEKDGLINEQTVLFDKIKINREQKEAARKALQQLESLKKKDEESIKAITDNYNNLFGFGTEIIERQEQERQRIARDLHDTTVQNLTAMIHKLEFCQQIIDADAIRAKIEMQLMINAIRETVDGMREIIYDLRPMSFDDIGFKETLLRALEKLQKNTDIKIEFDIKGDICKLTPAYELTILRIIQEAVNNCKKHSQAEKVNITIAYEENQIIIEIQDNGIGFDIEETKIKNQYFGFGISMMKERVYLLKGQIDICSEKGKGTEIKVVLPKKQLEETDEN